MARTQQNFSFYAGEDIAVECILNPVVDCTGWTIQFVSRQTLGQLPLLLTKTTGGGGITITNGPLGIFTIQFNSVDTYEVTPGAYFFDVQRIDAGHHTELIVGVMTILPPVGAITPP